MAATLCECPLCQATFQATPEMAGLAVQCPSCGRAVQLPEQLAGGKAQVVQATRIDVCNCPGCGQGFGYTTQMLGTTVACPHCSLSFKLSSEGKPLREPSRDVTKRSSTDSPQSNATLGHSGKPQPSAGPAPAKPIRAEGPASAEGPRPGAKRTRFRDSPETSRLPNETPTDGPAKTKGTETSGFVIQTDKPARSVDLEPLPAIRIEPESGKGSDQAIRATPAKVVSSEPNREAKQKPKVAGNAGQVTAVPQSLPGHSELSSPSPPAGDLGGKMPRAAEPAVEMQIDSLGSTSGRTNLAEQLPPLLNEPKAVTRAAAAELLPPKFYSSDPTIIRQKRTRGEQAFVLLPDDKGGFQRVNNAVIRIQHEGETIVLAAPDPIRVRRRRLVVNLLTLIVCLAVLYLVFRSLLN